jgi:hypothetical protein
MKQNLSQYHFLKESVLNFRQNLRAIDKIITNKIFTDDEILEIMGQLVPIKEYIESLEVIYLKNYS